MGTASALKKDMGMKNRQRRVGGMEVSLLADDIILYTKDLKDPTRKYLQLITRTNKVAGYH